MICSIFDDNGNSLSEKTNSNLKKHKNAKTKAAYILILVICTAVVGVMSFFTEQLSVQKSAKKNVAEIDTTPIGTTPYTNETATATHTEENSVVTYESEKVGLTDGIQTYVYATKTGKKYHRSDCSYLRNDTLKMTREQAENSGLTPCNVCKP